MILKCQFKREILFVWKVTCRTKGVVTWIKQYKNLLRIVWIKTGQMFSFNHCHWFVFLLFIQAVNSHNIVSLIFGIVKFDWLTIGMQFEFWTRLCF